MAFASGSVIRNATNLSNNLLRSFSTSIKSAHNNNHLQTHEYLEANSFIGSWQAPKDPKEAQARLARLRREYAKQVKQVRKNYIQEVELLRLEKEQKDEAKREALRVANEERKKLKAEAAKVRAEERKIADEEFRLTLGHNNVEELPKGRGSANGLSYYVEDLNL
ncbi:chromatin assembly factor 1 subunit A [Cucumis melo var. makuwa]|uniref:Chromatin assembly factor 1 subunit A n=1 Tax=Cucumis melo var. makuwa TaxID=1194695 RepID=A0A5A7U662_CUCMM|nr:chromatin assembly factor 1 subunit A [Cucumis melo var. makuwa]